MQLDTINTLYLELSQVATATTAKEIALRKLLDEVDAAIWGDARPTNYEPDRALALTTIIDLRDKKASRLEATIKLQAESLKRLSERVAAQDNALSDLGVILGDESMPSAKIIERVRALANTELTGPKGPV